MADPIIDNIARDMNRHVMGGGRQIDEATGKWEPVGILTGQQGPFPFAVPLPPDPKPINIQFNKDGQPITGGVVSIPRDTMNKASDAAKTALTDYSDYFNLAEDTNIPTWILTPKHFNLPDKPTPEEFVSLIDLKLGNQEVLHLPPAVLVEANAPRQAHAPGNQAGPRVTLCDAVKQTAENATYIELVPRGSWQPAMMLRCPVTIPKNKKKTTKRVKSRGSSEAIYELKGIPQGERWYLDNLDLLADGNQPDSLLEDAEVCMIVEYPGPKNTRLRIPISHWRIARENLSGLARPGADSFGKAPLPDAGALPYAASDGQPDDTLRLFQMASITNNGGYYIHVESDDSDLSSVSGDGIVIILILLFPAQLAAGLNDNSQYLMKPANAIAYVPKIGTPENNSSGQAIRFEELNHIQINPTSPPGCLTFGWLRYMSWPNDPRLDVTKDPSAFAESIHLVDYEVRDAAGNLIEVWTPIPDAANPDLSKNWRVSTKSADSVSPLSPTKDIGTDDSNRIRFENFAGNGIAATYLSKPPQHVDAKKKRDVPNVHRYRTKVRYAYKDVYNRMALNQSGQNNATLNLTAGFRDMYGNRFFPGCAKATRAIAYTDALIPPGEWPGFNFNLYANAGNLGLK
ncbi:MAG TPA: hypothetical protein VMH87_17665, partial [Pseudomonadales bacterium]|nr:hypothetical protein [Pseudomonadales bacterium]